MPTRTPVQEIALVTPEDVRRFAAQVLADAKEALAKDGGLERRSFVFAPGKDGTNVYVLCLSVPAEGLLELAAATNARFARELPSLKAVGASMGLTEPDAVKHIVNALAQIGMNEGEIIARFIQKVVVDSGAYACVHIADARALKIENATEKEIATAGSRGLASDPRSREVIVLSVETRSFQETTVVEYERDAEGKVTGFKDPEVLSSANGMAAGGRLVNLLKEIPLN